MKIRSISFAAMFLFAIGCHHADEGSSEQQLTAPVVAAIAVPHRFTDVVEGTGVIAALPENVHVVSPFYAGHVGRIATNVGASVTLGDALCEITLDPVAVAEVERQRRAVALAERTLERQRRAFAAGVTPRVALEQAEMDAANARADYAARTRDYDASSQRLILRAPITGLVTAIDVHVGQDVDGTTRAVTLVDPDLVAALVRFDAATSARIQQGQAATIVPLQSGGSALRATVVRTAAVVDPASQRVDVWLQPDGDPPRPGTYVRGTVEIGSAEHAAVPRAAIVKTDRGYQVFVLGDGVAHARDVTVGIFDGDLAEIRDGLAPGEPIAVGGAQELADGMRVAIEAHGS